MAGDSVTTGGSNILIGYNIDTPAATTSNHLNIGNAIYGDLSTGYVGIGTAAPSALLHVKRPATTDVYTQALMVEGNGEPAFSLNASSANPVLNPMFYTTRSRGSRTAKTIVSSGDSLMEIEVQGYDGAANRDAAYIEFAVDGTPGASDMPGRIEFHTQADGSGGALENTTPEMVIKNNGAVGIGTATPNEGKLEVKGGSVCVDTNSDDSATSCIANESDMRLKKNVRDLDYSVETLMKLRPVQFDWKHDDPEILKHYPLIARFAGQPHSIGFLAQDVQKLVPEAIEQETVGDAEVQYLQLDYTKLVPLMVKAAQEQQGEIIALNSEIKTLKNELQELRTMLTALPTVGNLNLETNSPEPLEETGTHEMHPDYSTVIPAMVAAAQEQQEVLTALKAENEKLKAELPQTQNALASAQKDIEGLKAYTSYGSDNEKRTIMLRAIMVGAVLLLVALAVIRRRAKHGKE